MLGWLSSWLKDVISVVLLAAIVDLLLPNKAMQRYARLVTGLIVLLVILTPLLKLVQGEDVQGRLDAGIKSWDREMERSQVKMPSLEDILKKAEETAGQSREQTADLARSRLESEVGAAVEQQTGLKVADVQASFQWDGQGGGSISSVSITLASGETAPDGGVSAQNQEAAEVVPVEITISTPAVKAGDDSPSSNPKDLEDRADSDSELDSPDPGVVSTIQSLVASGWQLNPKTIHVHQQQKRN